MTPKTQLQTDVAMRLPGKVRQIAALWAKLEKNWSVEEAEELQRWLHRLSQYAEAAQLRRLQSLSFSAESALTHLLSDNQNEGQHGALGASIQAMLDSIQGQEEANYTHLNEVLIALDDVTLAEDIATQLHDGGYHAVFCTSVEELEQTCETEKPLALLFDPHFFGPDSLETWTRAGKCCEKIKKIAIMPQADLSARLFAVRCNADEFFAKPVDAGALLEELATLNSPYDQDNTPYRILVVDDSKTQAAFATDTLIAAGMVAEAQHNPMDVLDAIEAFKPDVILLDVYMPECSGIELAQIIRQESKYVGLPIVFFSSEANLKNQLLALYEGGDDFLTKPISPSHLVAAVKIRARRYQELKAGMVRDSLTGLYNHTHTMECLEQEIKKASHHGTQLCFGMIDIDHFKQINDTHGHPVGDRVIKTTARLLKQTLRDTDTVGRYGGEEFAIIMPETDLKTATQLLETLREDMATQQHRTRKTEFQITISAGLVPLSPKHNTVEALKEAADAALYQAKESGRNQIRHTKG